MAATSKTCHAHQGLWNTRSVYVTLSLTLLKIFFILSNTGEVYGAPADTFSYEPQNGLSGRIKGSGPGAYPTEATLVSCGLLASLVLFVVACTGGCCLKVFGKRQQEDNHTMGFSNPIAGIGNSNDISSIDVRALEMGPIEFEPLPRLQDLTPISGYSHNSYRRGEPFSRTLGSDAPFIPALAMVPTDETSIYAHDWFGEPYRNFPRTHIEYVKEVGKGWFGKVIESEAEDIVPYAKKLRVLVKVLREDASGTEQMRFLDEARVYRESNHGNVLKLLGHSIEKLPFLLLMEHCPQGDLKSFLIANVSRAELLNSQGALLRMGHDIAKGLEWMDAADFIHKDLAARNCQVGSEGRIIIGDYGLSVQNFRDDYYWGSNVAIPLRWAAPETLHCTINTIQTLKVSKSSNVWTFGIVLWEIFEFGKLPYFELSDDDVISHVISERNHILGPPSRPGFPLKDQIYKLMVSCWSPEPNSRPSVTSVVEQIEQMIGSQSSQTIDTDAGVVKEEEEFDRKWNEFAEKINTPQATEKKSDENWESDPQSHSNNNHLAASKRKSVSFIGIEDEVPLVQVKTRLSTVTQFEVPSPDPKSSERISGEGGQRTGTAISTISLNSASKNTEESQKGFLRHSEAPVVSKDTNLWKVAPDPDDDNWRKRIELGEISQIVKEKSASVQDLMVLTHVEPSDLSDPDSLVITGQGQGLRQSTTVVETAAEIPNIQSGASSESSSSVFRKSRSENFNLTQFSGEAGTERNAVREVSIDGISASQKGITGASEASQKRVDSCKDSTITEVSTEKSCANDISVRFPSEDAISKGSLADHPAPERLDVMRDGANFSEEPSSELHKTSQEENGIARLVEGTPIQPSSNLSSVSSQVKVPTYSVIKTQNGSTPPTSGEGALGAKCETPQGVCNVSRTSQPSSKVAPPFSNGRLGSEPGSVGRLQTNLRDGKEGSQNISSSTDKISEGNDPDFFLRDNHVFEDFSLEIGAPRSRLEESTAPAHCYTATGYRDENYGESNVLFGPSEELGLNLYQRVTTELVSELVPADAEGETESRNETDSRLPAQAKSDRDRIQWDLSEPVHSDNKDESSVQDSGNTIPSKELQDEPNPSVVNFHLHSTDCRDKFIEDIEAAADELGSLVMTDLEEDGLDTTVIKETREDEKLVDARNMTPAMNAFENLTEPNGVEAASNLDSAPGNINHSDIKEWPESPGAPKDESTHDSLVVNRVFDCEESENGDDEDVDEESLCRGFVPSKWDQSRTPAKPTIKSPEQRKPQAPDVATGEKSSMKKSVSFERKKIQLVYQYPPPPPPSDSDDDEKHTRPLSSSVSLNSAIDWELHPEELEHTEVLTDDLEDEPSPPRLGNPMDVYRISADLEGFQGILSVEPASFCPEQLRGIVPNFTSSEIVPSPAYPSASGTSTLGELRHTRNKLKLDLSKGEASLLEGGNCQDSVKLSMGKLQQLDSGVGSSTNVSPFNTCDN